MNQAAPSRGLSDASMRCASIAALVVGQRSGGSRTRYPVRVHPPSVLFDARQGQAVTGIGRYSYELVSQFASLAPGRIRPLCWRSQLSRMRQLGLS